MKKIGIIGLSIITLTTVFGGGGTFAQASSLGTGNSQTGFVLTGCIDRTMKITAYYSTEPTQGVWFHGDYETEKKINGGGWHGASGRKVYNGMLAGPKKYPFSTTVSIPGFGWGSIYDRGSAIISSGGVDRIDIWAGAGLQGMVNALFRGSKTVTGTICSGGITSGNAIGPQGRNRSKYPTREKASKQMIWSLDMQQGNSGLTVRYLQSFLEQLGYVQIIDNKNNLKQAKYPFYILQSNLGLFETGTKLALCQFQQNTLGLSGDNQYCGYYGTNTRRTISKLIQDKSISIPQLVSQSLTSEVQKIKTKLKRILRGKW